MNVESALDDQILCSFPGMIVKTSEWCRIHFSGHGVLNRDFGPSRNWSTSIEPLCTNLPAAKVVALSRPLESAPEFDLSAFEGQQRFVRRNHVLVTSIRICLLVGPLSVIALLASSCSSLDVAVEPPAQVGNRLIATAPVQHHVLLDEMKVEFQRRNPNIVMVRVLDAKTPFLGASKHLVVGWGIREDGTFKGDFNDELFGVFVADGTLTAIERTIDIFPTQRWCDYEVRIESSNANTVTIVGRGETFSDSRLRRTYEWR